MFWYLASEDSSSSINKSFAAGSGSVPQKKIFSNLFCSEFLHVNEHIVSTTEKVWAYLSPFVCVRLKKKVFHTSSNDTAFLNLWV